MANKRFELTDGTIFESNEKGNYFYKSTGKMDKKGNPIMMRIPEYVFEQAFEEMITESADQAKADAEYEERLQKQAESDGAAEDSFNGKHAVFSKNPVTGEEFYHGFQPEKKAEKPKTKKTAKPRRSKDVAFEYCPNGTDTVTLTAKQVEFMAEMTKTSFWENGLESALWCDILADEIGGQFADKPMTVGAMISTLREKDLVVVGRDTSRQGKPKYMALTDLGKQVATELGLN